MNNNLKIKTDLNIQTIKGINMKNLTFVILFALGLSACAKPDDKSQLEERARIEGREAAEADFQKQMKEKDSLVQRAREEGRAQSEEEMRVQIANQDTLVEKARREGRAQAEEQLRIENGNLSAKSNKMEEDLSRRHQFFQAAGGTYEGTIATDQGNFNIRITLVPSLAPYPVDRVRQLEEITADITNLHFNAQIVQWSPENNLSSVGCRVSDIRPDLLNGVISIASPECPNLYILALSNSKRTRGAVTSKAIVGQIYKRKLKAVPSLVGEVRPTTNAAIYQLSAVRTGN